MTCISVMISISCRDNGSSHAFFFISGVNSPKEKSSSFDNDIKERNLTRIPPSDSGESEEITNKLKSNMLLESKDVENGSFPVGDENFRDLQPYDESSDLYLM